MKNINKIQKPIPLIFALVIEILLLILIFLVLVVGVLGVFLPFLPGLVIFGIGAGIYSLLVKNGYGRITPQVHFHLLKGGNKISQLKITKKFMGLVKAIKKRKKEKVKEQILKYGLILVGFNTALVLAFLFGLIGLFFLSVLLRMRGALVAFLPLLAIFVFAGGCAVLWFRFGQILGAQFKERKIISAAWVVLISILPLLAVLLLFSGIISLIGGFGNEILVLAFLGFILMAVLAAVFELLIVSLGLITIIK